MAERLRRATQVRVEKSAWVRIPHLAKNLFFEIFIKSQKSPKRGLKGIIRISSVEKGCLCICEDGRVVKARELGSRGKLLVGSNPTLRTTNYFIDFSKVYKMVRKNQREFGLVV